MVDAINFIPWGFTILSVLVAIYSIIRAAAKDEKKESKETACDLTTVIVKLEAIQTTVNRTGDMIIAIQNEIKSLDHRVTKLEVLNGMERALDDGR